MNTKSKLTTLLSFLLVLGLLAACAPAPAPTQAPAEKPAATQPPAEKPAATQPPTEAPAEVKDVVTWFQYDAENMDEKANEAVGNAYLRATMPLFNKAFAGKLNWVNQPKAFDKMEAELINLAQGGGDVPDIYELFNSVNNFERNGTLQDLSEWAKAQPWYKDLDSSALQACTGTDGKLYCIPLAQRPQVVFVWTGRFPNGYPTTIDDFLAQAEALKKEGHYAITFFGSTDKGGSGAYRGLNTMITSFGGRYDDGKGNMLLNTPENLAAIRFIREIVAKGYAPDTVFAGGFEEEASYMDSSAGSFPTGLHSWKFQNNMTAPDGKKYDTGTFEDPLNAFKDGELVLAHFPAAPGKTPGCGTLPEALAIPVGAKNTQGAYDFINWIMSPEQYPAFVTNVGGGLPTLKTALTDPTFADDVIIQQAAKVVSESACRPWFGSLARPSEAQPLIMNALYKAIKEVGDDQIEGVLTQAQEEYNAGN
ncbi:MAG: extracellular solute-binding protein [Anaerolineaceae bacterium]|nr:extracellular solute-binding protein [Anaerolineaceae bacterium]